MRVLSRSRRARLLRRVAPLVLALGVAGCISTTAIELRGGSAELNPRVRGDFGPAPSESDPPQRVYSDGSCPSGESGPCQWLSPILPLPYLNSLRRLPASNVLWTSAQAEVSVSYEWILKDVIVMDARGVDIFSRPGMTRPVSIGTCASHFLHDPWTRQPLRTIRGDLGILPPTQLVAGGDMVLRSCRSSVAARTANAPPQAIRDGCSERSMIPLVGTGGAENRPLCAKDVRLGLLGGSDMSHWLLLRPGAGLNWSNATFAPQPLLPHLFAVPTEGARTLRRTMNDLNDPENPREREGGAVIEYRFTFQVPLIEGGRWQESFTPDIVTRTVRAYRPSRGGQYLPIMRLEVDGIECAIHSEDRKTYEVDRCRGEMTTFAVTPAYQHERLIEAHRQKMALPDKDRARWAVRIWVPASDVEAPMLLPAEAVEIEFALTAAEAVSTASGGLSARPALSLAPAQHDFGVVRVAAAGAPAPAFALRNLGSQDVLLQRAVLTGSGAGSFQVTGITHTARVSENAVDIRQAALPLRLRAGEQVAIAIRAHADAIGVHLAALEVQFRDVLNQPGVVSGQLRAVGAAPLVDVLPSLLVLRAEPQGLVVGAERSALVSNAGALPFERRAIAIEGRDRAQFRIVGVDNASGGWTSPVPARVIEAGAAETIRVAYYPRARGNAPD